MNNPINVWINRAGPSRIHAMRMLKNNADGHPVNIHATRYDRTNPSQKFCDVGGTEPGANASDQEYADFALDYVRKNRIQVIIPTARMHALSSLRNSLEALGCVLMAPDTEIAHITDSKSGTYAAARGMGVPIPPHYVVNTAQDFRQAVITLREQGYTACVKPDTGWAASSFRIIQDDAESLESLLASNRPVVGIEPYTRALAKAQGTGRTIPHLIVMPLLEEPEVSVDVFATADGTAVASVQRSKDHFYRSFTENDEIAGYAHDLAKALPLPYLSNVQFRFLGSVPYLLEINPRPSAGLFHTEATGVNLYWESVRYAVTGEVRHLFPKKNGKVFLQETAVLL